MSCNHVGDLREGSGRLVNKWTRIAERTEETGAVTGRDCHESRR